jgi:hypothetical protein
MRQSIWERRVKRPNISCSVSARRKAGGLFDDRRGGMMDARQPLRKWSNDLKTDWRNAQHFSSARFRLLRGLFLSYSLPQRYIGNSSFIPTSPAKDGDDPRAFPAGAAKRACVAIGCHICNQPILFIRRSWFYLCRKRLLLPFHRCRMRLSSPDCERQFAAQYVE